MTRPRKLLKLLEAARSRRLGLLEKDFLSFELLAQQSFLKKLPLKNVWHHCVCCLTSTVRKESLTWHSYSGTNMAY